MQVDLHIHSTASDGTWTPPEVVAAALAAGLGAIAVTDHDSVANVAATHELAVAAGLKFIPGAEICSTKDDFCFHILGYGIDVTNKRLLDLLEHNERLLNSKDDESIKMLIERGWPLDFEEFLRYDYDRRRGGWKALAFLQDKGLCGDVNDFFSRIFTKEHDLGFPVFPSIKAAAQGARLARWHVRIITTLAMKFPSVPFANTQGAIGGKTVKGLGSKTYLHSTCLCPATIAQIPFAYGCARGGLYIKTALGLLLSTRTFATGVKCAWSLAPIMRHDSMRRLGVSQNAMDAGIE